jgi:hypothetical protein
MNIFILDYNPVNAAMSLCDKHVVKMALETAQIMSTINGGPYKPTHQKHPCVIWAGEGLHNYEWLYLHGMAICKEYTYRFNKTHASEDVIASLKTPLVFMPCVGTVAVRAMPDKYKEEDLVNSYRAYYRSKKSQFEMRYTKREAPVWL